MAILKTKVELYLEDNSKTWASEKNNIILQNDSDGNGTYLVWKTDKVTKPTDTELANAKEAAVDADWWRILRKTRDEKLVASDWTQGADVPSDIKGNSIRAMSSGFETVYDIDSKGFRTFNNATVIGEVTSKTELVNFSR